MAGPARRRAVPAGLLGLIGLVVAVETFVARHDLDFTTSFAADYRSAGRRAARARSGEILCFGDSLLKFGIAPGVIAARTGRITESFAILGGPPPASYFLLRRALEAGARPSAILIDAKASILQSQYRGNLRNLSLLMDARDSLELAWAARDLTALVEPALFRLFPSYRARAEIRASILARLRGSPLPWRLAAQEVLRNLAINRGAMLMASKPGYRGEIAPGEVPVLLPPSWKCEPVNEVFLHRLLRLTAAQGLSVYWLLPPITPQLQARREQAGLDAGYLRFVESVRQRYPHVTVVDGRHSGYDAAVFIDARHLDVQGAAAFSDGVADVLLRHSPADHWAVLPSYRPVAYELEDIEESKRLVRAERGLDGHRRRPDHREARSLR